MTGVMNCPFPPSPPYQLPPRAIQLQRNKLSSITPKVVFLLMFSTYLRQVRFKYWLEGNLIKRKWFIIVSKSLGTLLILWVVWSCPVEHLEQK